MAIPLAMLYLFLKKQKKLPFPHLWWLYVAFIVTCGFTHLVEAITTNYPMVRFAALVKVVTAVASWLTVFSLWRIMPLATLMKTPEELEATVQARTRELEEALRQQESLTKLLREREAELEQRDKQRTNFLAMLAHELRNPLAPVRTTIHLIREKYAHCLDAKYLEMDEMINRQLNHLSRMIDDLLDMARIQHGKIKLVMEACQVLKAIDGAMTVLESHQKVKHRVHVTCVRDLHILADSTRFEQILTNLLTNAIKYSEANTDIFIEAYDGDGFVHVSMKDCGKGIHPDVLPRIFDMFYQGEQSIDRANGGLGLGLTIVKRLMDLHGGTIKVESHVGIGTTFILTFPAVAKEHTPPPKLIESGAKRVLIVEDNRDTANSLSMLFSHHAHEVRVCHDGNSAVVTANLFDPDVVILDIGLPGLSGFEVARVLRSSTVTENVKIVAVTGYNREEDIREAKAAGINEYMVKPADLGKLLGTVLDKTS